MPTTEDRAMLFFADMNLSLLLLRWSIQHDSCDALKSQKRHKSILTDNRHGSNVLAQERGQMDWIADGAT